MSKYKLESSQCVYVECDFEARSGNYLFLGKSRYITYSEIVFVPMGLQHLMHMGPVRLYRIVPRYVLNGWIFEKKLLNTNKVSIFSTMFV